MSGKWIIVIIIALGFLTLFLNQRGTDFSFDVSPPGEIGSGGNERLTDPADSNGDGIIDERERRRALRQIERELERVAEAVREAEQERFGSPYREQVTLERGNARSRDRREEYVVIRADRQNTQSIPITGWRLESPISGFSVKIGGAARIARAGRLNTTDTVVLEPGHEAIVATPLSPVGVSFRTNICSGYLGQFQDFSPRLSRECPRAIDENLSALGVGRSAFDELEEYDMCFNHLERISRCELGRTSGTLEDPCNDFIREYLNYNGCVELHQDDIDFLEPEWRIFLKGREDLWRQEREVIKLLDREGKVVDVISY